MDLTKGIKTSEFWLSVVAFLVGVFLASGIVPDTHWAVKLAGALLAGLGTLGYGVGRGIAKSGVRSLLPFLLLLGAAASSLTLGGCASTPRGYLSKALTALGAADKIAIKAVTEACRPKVQACPPGPPAQCAAYVSCERALTIYQTAATAVGRELETANKALADVGVQ